MKIPHLAIAMLTIATVLPAGASLAQTTSFPLICRAGGGMTATLTAAGQLRVTFAPGTVAATPAPGQCAWIDRGFRAGEPGVLSISGNPTGVRYFVDALLAGGMFYAQVYNDNAGSMIVTRVGP